jgi:hypothetical protein
MPNVARTAEQQVDAHGNASLEVADETREVLAWRPHDKVHMIAHDNRCEDLGRFEALE